MASVDDAERTARSAAPTALAPLAEVLRGLERTGMWALALDEEGTHWRLEALKGPNKGRCLFAIPVGTSCRAYGAAAERRAYGAGAEAPGALLRNQIDFARFRSARLGGGDRRPRSEM